MNNIEFDGKRCVFVLPSISPGLIGVDVIKYQKFD